MEVSLQLYSINEETKNDFKKAIEHVSKIGYSGVEFAGYGGLTSDEMNKLLKKNDLYSVGSHSGLQVFENAFDEELQFNKEIGSKYIICPYATVDSMDEINHLVEVLNASAKKAQYDKIKVGYHNHAHEFVKIDGKYALDIIAEKTDDNVILELDVFWVQYAGVDPVEYIKKWGKKVELIHMKQIDDLKANVDMADGIIDMKKIKEAAEFAKYFILEHEEYDKPVWESIKNDFEHLEKI
ncbi:MAG: sugar phosphate isomerase [Anaerocolumna sp.]|jgi:sugar phosphate isomerase/epimerase|nr:sugar phosphate isomerase [Anaerocolumna sp.]